MAFSMMLNHRRVSTTQCRFLSHTEQGIITHVSGNSISLIPAYWFATAATRSIGWVESEVDEWVALLSPDHQFYPQHEIEQSITSLNVCALRIRDGP